jgi:hypothetical protein
MRAAQQAAPEGLRAIAAEHPLVRVLVGEVDGGLDAKAYIVSGCVYPLVLFCILSMSAAVMLLPVCRSCVVWLPVCVPKGRFAKLIHFDPCACAGSRAG